MLVGEPADTEELPLTNAVNQFVLPVETVAVTPMVSGVALVVEIATLVNALAPTAALRLTGFGVP